MKNLHDIGKPLYLKHVKDFSFEVSNLAPTITEITRLTEILKQYTTTMNTYTWTLPAFKNGDTVSFEYEETID